MGADLSRVRFDARRDHAAVVLQQGRLLLDADWNELVDILDRRIRAGVADLDSPGPAPGTAGVAVVPRTTPDAFRVTLAGGVLTVGRGRMYVDGLLAEHHGSGPATFDPMLAEETGSADTPYDQQPHWPTPEPLPQAGSFLAYLDVWNRELTHIEAPDLIDPAIGVDTTARTQTVWQVRLHPLDGPGSCGTPDESLPGWPEVIAPSGARLTVGTIEVGDDDEPCALPPSGGYRGLENQTYRVQVHAAGGPGTARFVWSRDNGSVTTTVLEVLPGGTGVRPASFGRDEVLGFADGDWVEVLDDHRELAGQAGELRLIEVHDEDGTITFAPPLPADLVMSSAEAADRHLRLRRWDQQGTIRSGTGTVLEDLDAPGASGAITVPASSATTVVLEHGIVVSFASAGGTFRIGDHWVFAARAADSSVERLTDAPPRGIHHHYARLGFLTFPDVETDCRTLWPPHCDCGQSSGCGDCTACVTPESHASGALTIQAAVDQVIAAGGGTVCLEAGAYHLDEGGVRIEGARSVRLRGQGLRTVLFARARGVEVRRSAFVTVEELTVVSAGRSAATVLDTTAAVTVQGVTALTVGSVDLPAPGIQLAGVAVRPVVRDCVIVAPVGIGGEEERPLLSAELDLSDNLLVCRDVGINLSGRVAHLLDNLVAGNTVLRAASAGIRLLGGIAPQAGLTVQRNQVRVGGTGITVSGAGATVAGNAVVGTEAGPGARNDGILVEPSTLGSLRGPTVCSDNAVTGVGGRGIAVLAPVTTLRISGNRVRQVLDGIVMDQRARADVVLVHDNVVTEVASREFDENPAVTGIQVVGALRASVRSNTVRGVGTVRPGQGDCTGIDVIGCLDSHVAGNSVEGIGFAERGGADLGIAVRGRVGRTQVTGNAVRRQPAEVDEDGPSAFIGLLVGSDRHPREPGVVHAKGYALGTGVANFAISSLAAFAADLREATVTVEANTIAGGGETPTTLVGVGGEVVLTGNHMQTRRQTGAPALHLLGLAATVSANRFRGGEPSVRIEIDPKRIAVVGNLSSLGIVVNGGPLDPPWSALNPNGV
jgi:hypothetical protein